MREGSARSPQNTCLHLLEGQAYAALKAAHLAVVASGTVTVEAALAATPTVIIYRLAPLTYEVAKRLIRVDHIGMANLLAGAGLFPELIQADFTAEHLAREVIQWIKEPGRLEGLQDGLAGWWRTWDPPGPRAGGPGGVGAHRRACCAHLDSPGGWGGRAPCPPPRKELF